MKGTQDEPLTETGRRVRDPVCGMEIDAGQAAASRLLDGQTYYFCSAACADKFTASPEQYRVPPAPSATTGVPDSAGVRSLELPIVGLGSASSARAVEQALLDLVGVEEAAANPTVSRVHVVFDPARVGVDDLVRALERIGHRADAASVRIGIDGIYCASCVSKIEDALLATPGVLEATVNPATEEAAVRYVPSHSNLEALRRAVELGGYRVRETDAPASPAAPRLNRSLNVCLSPSASVMAKCAK